MSELAIKVEDVSKLYRLGQIGTGSFKHDLKRLWHKLQGKDDPFAKVGVVNDRTKKSETEWVWALKDINFEVKQGEVLGIIGRNGAGKSTLLKILSKITAPTTGQITINGRIASLLEVGTGFHPELSGRDNIFLNGAILGMKKWEIQKKFDEIMDFSGVEAYIDTPVKRYSSGMYVRLAFAVAAFLEPDILIVDEVLAVGDAEFQKKCLGRMKDVSTNDGRTVLFVSHSMTSVQALCNNAIFLDNGQTEGRISTNIAVEYYLYGKGIHENSGVYITNEKNVLSDYKNIVSILEVQLLNRNDQTTGFFKTTEPIKVRIIWKNIAGVSCSPNFQLKVSGSGIVALIATDSPADWSGDKKKDKGVYYSDFMIPANWLNANDYFVSVALDSHSPRVCYEVHLDIMKLSITDPMDENSVARGMFTSVREEVVLWPALECSFKKID